MNTFPPIPDTALSVAISLKDAAAAADVLMLRFGIREAEMAAQVLTEGDWKAASFGERSKILTRWLYAQALYSWPEDFAAAAEIDRIVSLFEEAITDGSAEKGQRALAEALVFADDWRVSHHLSEIGVRTSASCARCARVFQNWVRFRRGEQGGQSAEQELKLSCMLPTAQQVGFDSEASDGCQYVWGMFERGEIDAHELRPLAKLYDRGRLDAREDRVAGKRIFSSPGRHRSKSRSGRQAWHDGYLAVWS